MGRNGSRWCRLVVIVPLQPEDFDQIFSQIEWAFDNFAERSGGEASKPEMARQVLDTERQCWLAVDKEIKAVALTRVQGKAVELTHCTGRDREQWQEQIIMVISEWTKSIGAKHLRVICRPGWTKFLKGQGLRETHRVLEVDYGQ